ncbi:MAG: glycine cleavage system protein GcvH [Melioribacteraceae bacterium]|jgi:glycine cleavage system H protein|nr:glycine cleavage system protein GcvH [Melioribacteraceae bacterium]
MNVPDGMKFSKDHEWIKVEGSTVSIGVSDYAQSELGDIVFVDIESDLEEINSGETFGSIEAVKTVSDLYAPISGKVLEVNPALEDEPELVNTDPYGDGWLIKVECSDLSQLDSLLSTEDYKKQIGA